MESCDSLRRRRGATFKVPHSMTKGFFKMRKPCAKVPSSLEAEILGRLRSWPSTYRRVFFYKNLGLVKKLYLTQVSLVSSAKVSNVKECQGLGCERANKKN
jgi:hypothetical protein